MGRAKKDPAGQRRRDNRNRHSVRGNGNGRWKPDSQEDDPFHDLRPEEDDMRNSSNEEYIWPDLNDEDEDDD